MNNPKRVFANNNDINYIEYMNKLKGEEIYKSVLNKYPENKYNLFNIKENELTNFINHETLLNITKTFYKYNQPYEHYDEEHPPTSINDGTKSHIEYCVLQSHIKDCDYCCKCKNITEIYECNELKNYLYPYGSSKLRQPIFKYPIPLKLDKEECNYTPVYQLCTPVCHKGYHKGCDKRCDKRCNKGCNKGYHKGCEPLCNKRYKKECDRDCIPLCNKRCKKVHCQNIYPSQHQFKCYDINCENDCDKEKRINAYASYPQIKNNCGLIRPYPCNPCEPIEKQEPYITLNRCVIRKCKYDINICGGIPSSGCKCF